MTHALPTVTRLLTWTLLLGVILTTAFAQDAALVEADTLKNHHADLNSQLSSDNVSQMQLAWTYGTEAPVSHMPLIEDDRLYFADWSGKAYALNASTGELIWEKQIQETVMMEWPWHGFAGTGAIAGDLLIEASTEGTAYGINKETGEVVWQTEITEDPEAGNISKLTAYDGLVYIGLSSVEEPLSAMMPEMPINFQGEVVALDAQTGEIIWERPLVESPHNGVAVWSSFAVDPETDTLYFTTGNNYTGEATELSDALVAVNAKTGNILWASQVTQHDVWTKANPKGPDYDFGAGPQLFEVMIDGQERQLVGAGQKSGVFYVWDRLTGEPIWSHTVGYGHIGGGIHGEASIGEDRIYLWGNNAFPYTNPEQHPMDIKAVDAATGAVLWVIPKAQPALQISAGFLANDVYFIGSLDGMVRAYRASDGELLWTSQPHGAVASSVWVENGMLFWGGSVPENWGGAAEPNGIFAYAAGTAGQAVGESTAAMPKAAMQNLQNLLTQGIDTVPTPEVVTAFQNLRTNIQDDSELQVVAVAIEPVESALTAEPFDQAALVEALQNLALAMRTAADAGDATLTVELASLVDQTAAFIQNEGFTPRMEVETP